MASQKRTHEEVDPDYEDVCQQQTKRQREMEQDAKQSVMKHVQQIVRNEFHTEINNKELELQQVDKRLSDARLMMDRLRACVVANYYGQANKSAPSHASSISAPPPSIHPAVKKYLGKRPAHHEVKSDVTKVQSQSQQESVDHTDSEGKQKEGNKKNIDDTWRRTKLSSDKQSLSQPSTSMSRSSASSFGISSPAVTAASTYDDRRARFKIKKKIIIGNVSKYIPVDHREPKDMSSHKWMVYVRGPKSDPDISGFVKKVWFFLHHSYKPNDLVEISSPPFHLTRRGWGEFPVRVQLHFVDPRNKKVDIIHHLKLDKTFTGLQTLGAETVVEVEMERDFFENVDTGCNTFTISMPQSSSVLSLHRPSPSSSTSSPSLSASVSDTRQSTNTENSVEWRANSSGVPVSSEESVVKGGTAKVFDGGGKTFESGSIKREETQEEVDTVQGGTHSLGDYNVTIAHDVDEPMEGLNDNTEEVLVDVCEPVDDKKTSHRLPAGGDGRGKVLVPVTSHNQINISIPVTSTTTLSTSSSSLLSSTVSSQYSKSTTSGSVQYLVNLKDFSQIKEGKSAQIVKAVAVPAGMLIAQPSSSLPASSAGAAKVVNTAQLIQVTSGTKAVASPLQQNSKSTAGANSSTTQQAFTVLDSSVLKNTVNSSCIASSKPLSTGQHVVVSTISPSLPMSLCTAQSAKHQSLLSNKTGISSAGISPTQIYTAASKPSQTPTLIISSDGSQVTRPGLKATSLLSTSPLLTTQQHLKQNQTASTINANAQKMIILNPAALRHPSQRVASPIVRTNDGNKMSPSMVTQKSGVQRQVSLLTGQIVTQQSLLSSASLVSPTQRFGTVGNNTTLKQTPNQAARSNNPSNQVIMCTPNSANQILHLHKTKPQSLLLTAASTSVFTTTSTTTPLSTNNVNGLATQEIKQEVVYTSPSNPALATQKQLKQFSLLKARTSNTHVPNIQSNTTATTVPGTSMVLQVPKQLFYGQQDSSTLDPPPKMSAIGITKHGKDYRNPQAVVCMSTADQRALVFEERKKNQYNVLKTWKENPELYDKGYSKARKIVLAARDRIEGEVDIIPPLILEDYNSMGALVKAAVKLHPLVQAKVNKLTHPYCAESLEQWDSWPVGKQRASEWHRACFVLKYLKSCLGNSSKFMGEKLMITRQLVEWCRQHAFSPCLGVKKIIKEEPPDEFTPDGIQSCHSHIKDPVASFTPVVDVEIELTSVAAEAITAAASSSMTPKFSSTINGMKVEEDADLEIVDSDIGNQKIKSEKDKCGPEKSSQTKDWLPLSDGAIFVCDELRKRGIKLRAAELEPGVFSLAAADMIYKAMQEFSADILREALAAKAKSDSETPEVSCGDVNAALRQLPEAQFCSSRYLGKEENTEGEKEGR